MDTREAELPRRRLRRERTECVLWHGPARRRRIGIVGGALASRLAPHRRHQLPQPGEHVRTRRAMGHALRVRVCRALAAHAARAEVDSCRSGSLGGAPSLRRATRSRWRAIAPWQSQSSSMHASSGTRARVSWIATSSAAWLLAWLPLGCHYTVTILL